MLSKLSRFLAGSAAPQHPAPGKPPVAVIGDIHGCLDLAEWLVARIGRECPEARIVLAGDMIDRGPDSAGVLDWARALPGAVALRGNHEQMLLDALDDPEAAGPVWLRNGGQETLASFGISEGDAPRDALRAALGPEREAWLRGLPLWWQSGTLVVTHAGADPRLPMAHQNPQHLLWGHPAFGRVARRDGLWIAHGHTIVRKPRCAGGVVSVDTGAWRSGRLTAALISDDGVRFLSTGA